jgi:hypothetical protein
MQPSTTAAEQNARCAGIGGNKVHALVEGLNCATECYIAKGMNYIK